MKNILSILLLLLILSSCHNNSSKDKQQFDSVNNELNKLQVDKPVTNTQLYDSLRKKWPDTLEMGMGKYKYDKVDGMHNALEGFYSYIKRVRKEFYQVCGDSTGERIPEASEDSIALTEQYFFDKTSSGNLLFPMLASVTYFFTTNATSETAKGMTNKLTSVTSKRPPTEPPFMQKYFKGIPPVAAITIINSFEAQVKNTELRILMDYINQ
jgi:hypothetical protein